MINEFTLKRLTTQVDEYLAADDQVRVYVLAPKSMSDDLERHLLLHRQKALGQQKNVAYATNRLRVTSLNELIMAAGAGEDEYFSRPVLTDSLRTRLVQQALADVSLTVYEQNKQKAGFAAKLGNYLARYFENDRFGLRKVEQFGPAIAPKLADIQTVADRFEDLVAPQATTLRGYATPWGMMAKFTQLVTAGKVLVEPYRLIIVADEQVPVVEAKLMQALADQAQAAITYTLSPVAGSVPEITTVQALDPDLEAKFVVDEIARLVAQKKIRLSDVIVYAPSDATYLSELATAFNQANLACNLSQNAPLTSLPLPVLLDAILAEPAQKFTLENMLRLLKTRLIVADFELGPEDADLTASQRMGKRLGYLNQLLPQVENYLFRTGVNCQADWETEWQLATGEHSTRLNQNANRLRQAALTVMKAATEVHDGPALVQLLQDQQIFAAYARLTQKTNFKLKQTNVTLDGVAARLAECRTRFYELINSGLTGDQAEWRAIFRATFSEPFTSGHQARLNEVKVVPITAAQLPTYKYAFITGMNDQTYPGRLKAAGMLTLKQEMALAQQLPSYRLTGRHVQKQFKRKYDLAQQSASQGLYLTYAQNDAKGESLTAAKWWLNALAVTSQSVNLTYDFFLPAFADLGQLAHQQAITGWQKETDYTNTPTNLTPELAQALYLTVKDAQGQPALMASYTKIETYAKNPYEYFLKYGLKLKKKEKKELTASERGTYVHSVLEHALGLEDQHHDELKNQQILRLLASSRPNQWVHKRLDEILAAYLAKTKEWQAASGNYRTVTENRFGKFTDYQPDYETALQLTTDQGCPVLISGDIDRFDLIKLEDQTVINVVDYKTGKANDKVKLLDVKLANGINLQLPIYAWALMTLKEKEQWGLHQDYQLGALVYSGVNEEERDNYYKGVVNQALRADLVSQATGYGKIFEKDLEQLIAATKAEIKKLLSASLAGEIPLLPYKLGGNDGLNSDYQAIMNFSEELGNQYRDLEEESTDE